MHWITWNFLALSFSVLTLVLPAWRMQRVGYLAGSWASALFVLIGGGHALFMNTVFPATSVPLAFMAGFSFTLDPTRGFFLLIAAAVFALSIGFIVHESTRYRPDRRRALLALTVLLQAAIVTVLIAGAVLSFVFAWEAMSLLLWALISFDTRQKTNARAGLFTLAWSEAGTLAALSGLLILANAAGTTSLSGIAAAAPDLSHAATWAGLLLTFFGFGVKTGIVPVNIWMQEGYAAAPPCLTPVFSGSTMNLGVFALWAIDGPLASHALWPALVILVIGAITALLGIVYALVSRRIPHLLTHSSIENLGVVVAALGAGFAFTALGHPVLAGLALVAGLYHMLNHSTYKTLLFLGSGAIRSATGIDELDRLGGLMNRVPLFASLFVIGTFAIAALPPFNGFVSEWLTLESLLRVVEIASIPVRITFALSGALLALTAGLGLTCFILLAGATLLGLPRSKAAASVQGITPAAWIPMAILTVACFGLGVLATGVIPIVGRLTAQLTGTNPTASLVPGFFTGAQHLATGITASLTDIGAQVGRGILPLRGLAILHSAGHATPVVFAMSTSLTFAVLAFLVLVVWTASRFLRRRRTFRRPLWDAGLTRLRPEMTYTATAFAAPVRVLFDRLLRPTVAEHAEHHGAFLTGLRRRTVLVHIVDRWTLNPLIDGAKALAAKLARMHEGRVTLYAAYIVATLVAALLAEAVIVK